MDFITVYWKAKFKICVITSSRRRFRFPSAAKLKPAVIQPAEPTHVSMFHCPGSRSSCRARGRSSHREAGDEPEHHHRPSDGETAQRSHEMDLVKGSGDEAESVQTEISKKTFGWIILYRYLWSSEEGIQLTFHLLPSGEFYYVQYFMHFITKPARIKTEDDVHISLHRTGNQNQQPEPTTSTNKQLHTYHRLFTSTVFISFSHIYSTSENSN